MRRSYSPLEGRFGPFSPSSRPLTAVLRPCKRHDAGCIWGGIRFRTVYWVAFGAG